MEEVYKMSEAVDIVILWVDDTDKSWIDKKKLWENKYGILSKDDERYRDWGNLKFLFRGIEKYASWVNHVFLVTDNQVPQWLDESYEKVTVVDHTEIIDKEFLPTFNSHSIELNIHKIKDLSENFIYFNDDIFIIKQTSKEDFFENNLPKDNAILNIITPIKDQDIHQFTFNNLTLINHSFHKHQVIKDKLSNWFTLKNGKHLIKNFLLLPWNVFPGFNNPHLCLSYKKDTFTTVWDKYGQELLKTTKSKFRENHNYNQWLMRYWQLASNNFIPRKGNLGNAFELSDSNSIKECSSYIREQRGKIICINDGEYLRNFKQAKTIINKEFISLFPEKSKFER